MSNSTAKPTDKIITKDDYKDFVSARVPPSANDKLLDKVHLKIAQEKPSVATTAAQMVGIHLLSSVLTLMICPQFGVRIFFEGHGLMSLFMRAGSQACFIFCGAFYLGTTFLLARYILKPDAWILIRKVRGLFAGALALLSMGALTMLGHKLSFDLGLMWFLGAYAGAWLTSLPHPKRSLISNG